MDTTIPGNTTVIATEAPGPLRAYFRRLSRLFFEPGRFFREDLIHFSVSEALAFGIVSAWVASVIAFFFQTLNGFLLRGLFESWVQRVLSTEQGLAIFQPSEQDFIWTAGFLLLDPFFSLLRILLAALVLFTFARILIDENRDNVYALSFSNVLKIQAVSLAAQWFAVVPFFGGVLGFLVNLILLVTGVRECFRVSNRRSIAVVLAPYLILLFVTLLGLAFLVLSLAALPFEEILSLGGEL
jgi:hypothetical protein